MDLKNKAIALGLAGALALVYQFEGLSLTQYNDIVKVSTICRGHTGPDVKPGMKATLQQCDNWTYADLLQANAVVDSCVTAPLNQNQRGAFVDFALNVGKGRKGVKDGMCVLKTGAIPTHLKLLNAGRYTDACLYLLKWDKAGGVVVRGIVRRRTAESELCLKEVYAGN